MTLEEAWEEIKKASEKGKRQGEEYVREREARRVIIAYRIKEQRTKKGYTQAQFSEVIDSNPLTYRGYENCVSDIPIVYLIRIAKALDISLDYITGITDIPDKSESTSLEERVRKLEEILLPRE